MPTPKASSFLPVGCTPPMDLEETSTLLEMEIKKADPLLFEPIKTGLIDLDETLGGGMQAEDLIVMGGPANVGKTAMMLNWALNVAKQNALAIVICYEHSVLMLFQRLICIASQWVASEKGTEYQVTNFILRAAYKQAIIDKGPEAAISDVLHQIKGGIEAWAMLTDLWRNVWLIHGDGNHTDVDAIEKYIELGEEYLRERSDIEGTERNKGKRKVLFVDYLQIVPVRPQHGIWLLGEERVNYVVKALSNMATRHNMAVVSIAAADNEALKKGRVHIEDLAGSDELSLLQYEPGAAVMLNMDVPSAEGEVQIRISLEKNRAGLSQQEWRATYKGAVFHFGPDLVAIHQNESWQNERSALVSDRPEMNQGGAN